jgi:hypothetical protein
MASKQTRRSISVRGTTYAQLRDFCAEHDRSMSDVVEELLSRILEGGEASRSKTVAPLVARAPRPTPAVVEVKPEPKIVPRVAPEDRGAVRVDPRPAPAPAPVPPPRAALPPRQSSRPGPARPVPVANAGRPAPTPASKVLGTKEKPKAGDYRAIRF